MAGHKLAIDNGPKAPWLEVFELFRASGRVSVPTGLGRAWFPPVCKITFPTQVLFSIACKCVAVVWLLVPTLGGVAMSLPVTSDSARCLCVSLLLVVLIVVVY